LRSFEVVGALYRTIEERLSPRGYLDALVTFIGDHAQLTDGRGTLSQLLYQPLGDLIDSPTTVGERPVNQLLIAIEVLRKWAGVAAAVEDDYRLAAYETMLANIGTSYDEIRLIRGADKATGEGQQARQALADRLGITLSQISSGQDELDQLFHAPSALTEQWLATMFGLPDTAQAPSDTTPTLLGWQKGRLRGEWADEDYPSPSGDLKPIIDPDLIDATDFANPIAADAAYSLWTSRTAAVAAKYSDLVRIRTGFASPLDGFNAIVNEVLTPPPNDTRTGAAFLQTVETDYKAGQDVAAALRTRFLTIPAFIRLLGIRALAAAPANTVTDTEWTEAYDILVQAWKERNYAAWRDAESGIPPVAGQPARPKVTLSPDSFRISRDPIQLTAWRASDAARRTWQDRLQSRIDQEQAIADAFNAAIDATREMALPILREILVAKARDLLLAATGRALTLDETADYLTGRLQLDVRTGGAVKTTRIEQAVETLQGLVFSLRGGLLDPSHPAANWNMLAGETGASPVEIEQHFEEEWHWLGSYANWRAAMFVFFYPENLLAPSLLPHQTKEFGDLVGALRAAGALTAAGARDIAKDFVDAVKTDLDALVTSGKITAAERQSLVLTDKLTNADLQLRQAISRKLLPDLKTPSHLTEFFDAVPIQIALELQKSGDFEAALGWFRSVYAYNLPLSQRKIYSVLETETSATSDIEIGAHWARDLNPHDTVAGRPYPYTRYTVLSIARCFLDFADSEFARDTGESLALARSLYATARSLLRVRELPPAGASEQGVILPNPVLDAWRLRAELQLAKLRQGRNIAGVKRELPAPTVAVPLAGTLPATGRGALPTARTATVLRPTPYRYKVLLERSKQLVALAQQIEAGYLAALEKQDAENYNLLKANNDLDLATMGVELQKRRVTEAQDGQDLITKQKARNDAVKDEYTGMINAGLNDYEQQMIDNYRIAGDARALATLLNLPLQLTNVANLIPGVAVTTLAAAGANILADLASATAQVASVKASFERQKEQWQLQVKLAEKDGDILDVQGQLADDHLSIVQQEQAIATTQSNHATAVAHFLATKFTNAELYEWMSGVLRDVYTYFLQQATATAQLAQSQLGFERAEPPPAFIQADYWELPTQNAAAGGAQATDRRGLTGSARLLEDITQLDQYAFESDKRKLNLSQTFSLAQLSPYEFQRLRDTGIISFQTRMELFDRAFPGHYLRQIKRVRTSVIALIPPVQGIRATLAASGSSTVVVGGDSFAEVPITRDPELVALTSPSNATGLFELDMQSEMLQPFEDRGVDTKWQLRLPKAANPFDFDTIADVLVTIDYTALDSADYRDAVIRKLDLTLLAERAFSFRNDFADQWYDLNNPPDSPASLAVTFHIDRNDFPPNLKSDDIQIRALLAYFVPKDGVLPEVSVALRRAPGGSDASATSAGNVISTRRASGIPWQGITGAPIGDWTLTLPSAGASLFRAGKVDDILFVMTYAAELPAWA
jgi:hypothetical protein